MLKGSMAFRLLHSDLNVRGQIVARVKHLMEEADMALYDRSSGIGFVYSNLGELLRRVQAVGATARPSLFQQAVERKDATIRNDSMEQLKENVTRLQEMHSRLQFMLSELECLVKKG